MQKNKIAILVFLFLCVNIQNLWSQKKVDSVQIQVRITDSITGHPLDYCSIDIYENENRYITKGISTDNGIFNFFISAKDSVINCKVSRVGYTSTKLTFPGISSSKLNIRLIPFQQTLAAVSVTSKNITRDVDKLSYKVNHDKFPSGTKAINVLREVPLLSVSPDGTIMIKNSASDVYINGKIASADIIKTLSADMIKTVEVITNPSSAFNAAGNEGFVNIVLLKPKVSQYKGNLGLVTGLNQTLFFPGANFSVSTKKVFFTINSSIQSSIQNSNFNTKRLNSNNEMVYWNDGAGKANIFLKSVNSSIFYDIDSTSEVSGQISYSSTKINSETVSTDKYLNQPFSYNSLSNFDNNSNFHSFEFEYKKRLSNFSGFAVDYRTSLNSPVSISDLSTIDNGNNQIINKNIYSDSVRNVNTAFQTSYYGAFLNQKLNSEIGISYSFERISDQFKGLQYDKTTNVFFTDLANSDLLFLKNKQFAAFLITKFQLAGLNVRAGLRYENLFQEYKNHKSTFSLSKTYNNLFPNLVIQKKINESLNLLINYKRKIKRPDISILSPFVLKYGIADEYIGNPYVNPEYINSYDINLDFQSAKSFYEFSSYIKYTKNPIIYLSSTSDTLLSKKYTNANFLTVTGISIAAKRRFTDALQINTNAFFEHYKFSNEYPIANRYSGINFGASVNISNEFRNLFSSYLHITYTNKTYDYQSFSEKYPDASLTIARNFFKDKFLIGLAWNNIFNTSLKSKYVFNDRNIYQIRNSKTNVNMIILSVNYNFGKYFMSTKSQRGINQSEVKRLEISK